jgi:hypothetical protein
MTAIAPARELGGSLHRKALPPVKDKDPEDGAGRRRNFARRSIRIQPVFRKEQKDFVQLFRTFSGKGKDGPA